MSEIGYYCDFKEKGTPHQKQSKMYRDLKHCIERALVCKSLMSAQMSFLSDVSKSKSLKFGIARSSLYFQIVMSAGSIPDLEKIMQEFCIDTSWTPEASTDAHRPAAASTKRSREGSPAAASTASTASTDASAASNPTSFVNSFEKLHLDDSKTNNI